MMVSLNFRDETLSDSFELEGYVIVRRSPEKPLSVLSEYIASRPVQLQDAIHYSLMSNTFEGNKEIASQVRAGLDGILQELFVSHQVYNPSYLIKPPLVHQEFMLHQDWCFTDTDRFRMGTVWVPLCDVDETNGCLTVVPRSHHAFRTFISGSLHTARIPMAHLPAGVVRPLPMRFGDVLIFNPLVFHGSFPNTTARPRTIATVNVLSEGAPFCYYHRATHAEIHCISLHEDAVLKDLPNLVAGRIPNDAQREAVPYIHSIPSAEQLSGRLAEL